MGENNKPPIGLVPKWVRQNERYYEVCQAITRYYNSGERIPISWVEEYNDLVFNINLSQQDGKECKVRTDISKDIPQLLEQLDIWIDDCDTQCEEFFKRNMEISEASSLAMSIAYENVKNYINGKYKLECCGE